MSVNTSYSELNPAACWVCLAVDVRLHTIADTPLQLVYERLTNISLHTADMRPIAACYLCYALLYKAGKLLLMAANAERVLSQVFEKYSKITTESISLIDREANGLAGSLAASRAEYFDNIPLVKVENVDEVKTEPGLEDDSTEMEFEETIVSGYPQSLHENCNNNNDTHNIDCEDKIPVNRFIAVQQDDTAEELLEDKKTQKDVEVEKLRMKKSFQQKQKHESENSKTHAESQYTCNNCQKTYRIKVRLERHIKTNACQQQCNMCLKQFRSFTKYKNHLNIHSGETPYKCKMCQSEFNNLGNLHRHVKTIHGNYTFECNVCQRKFNRRDYLINHLKVHSSDKLYECSICKQQYKDQSNYNRHVKQHTKEKTYECNICKMKFTLLHHLKTHLRSHSSANSNEKRYKCGHCPMSFDHQAHLRNHMRSHTGERPFECNICERRFIRRTHLRSHLNTHNKPAKS